MELKGVEVRLPFGIETEAWWAERRARREVKKSSRIGVHRADGVVRE
jgi:hypothetical protein